MNNKPWIFPIPKKISIKENEFSQFKGMDNVAFLQECKLSQEGYVIEISDDGVYIYSNSPKGKYYGKVTLKQLLYQYGDRLPCMRIEDEPDFLNRGVMLDIGRNKIPTMKSLYELIDILSELKYNQLQLYMEGYAFEYKEFKNIFTGETPITAEEYRQLDAYAKERFIDLVPNQNCFGHMAPWLAKDEFKELAENIEGMEIIPGKKEASTLNPVEPKSLELVEKLFNELLPNFTSEYANIGFDEPFELGTGQSKEACEKKGTGVVYLEYLLKVVEIIKKNGKKPMFWGDIIIKYPELIEKLPKDITVLDWNYEGNVSFEEHSKIFAKYLVDFYVCPGTSAWGSISGRTSNMKMNIVNAAEMGKKYGAKGMIVTDWGDLGHWQAPVISYPGYVLGAAASWNVEESKNADIEGYLNKFIFKDTTNTVGKVALELGDYRKLEGIEIQNFTLIFAILAIFGVPSKAVFERIAKSSNPNADASLKFNPNISGLKDLLNNCETVIDQADLKNENAELIIEEYNNTINLLRHGVTLIEFIMNEDELDSNERVEKIINLEADITNFIDNYKRLWRERNREGGLNRSIAQFLKIQKQYGEMK
jgi:N-acetyl-beta-hexosaminidase